MSNSEENSSEVVIERCPDGHTCLNGGRCIENPYKEKSYYCDCQEDIFDVRYEGLRCEHKETSNCRKVDGITSHPSFCTNSGICVAFVGPDEAHQGCECPVEYEGSFCQFVKGTRPEHWPYSDAYNENTGNPSGLAGNPKKSSGSKAGTIVGVLFLSVSLIIIAAFMYAKKFRVRGTNHKDGINDLGLGTSGSANESMNGSPTGRDMNIEADGAVLQAAMKEKDGVVLSPTSVVADDNDNLSFEDVNIKDEEKDLDII